MEGKRTRIGENPESHIKDISAGGEGGGSPSTPQPLLNPPLHESTFPSRCASASVFLQACEGLHICACAFDIMNLRPPAVLLLITYFRPSTTPCFYSAVFSQRGTVLHFLLSFPCSRHMEQICANTYVSNHMDEHG